MAASLKSRSIGPLESGRKPSAPDAASGWPEIAYLAADSIDGILSYPLARMYFGGYGMPVIECPSCKSENPDGAKFCVSRGAAKKAKAVAIVNEIAGLFQDQDLRAM